MFLSDCLLLFVQYVCAQPIHSSSFLSRRNVNCRLSNQSNASYNLYLNLMLIQLIRTSLWFDSHQLTQHSDRRTTVVWQNNPGMSSGLVPTRFGGFLTWTLNNYQSAWKFNRAGKTRFTVESRRSRQPDLHSYIKVNQKQVRTEEEKWICFICWVK